MKILLAVATLDFIHEKTVSTLFSIVKKYSSKWTIDLVIETGCYIHKNRQKLADYAIKGNYDYLFYIDSDMCFAAETLERLIDDNKEIVGCHYNCRSFPLRSTMKMADENGNLIAVNSEDLPKELFKVHALGTGCMLIKVSAFSKIPKPWFWYGSADEPDEWCGEDLWFCRQAAKAGIDVWCDPNIEVKHEGYYLF